MNLLKQYTPKDGYTPLVKPGKDGIELLEVGILRLQPGSAYRGVSEGQEVCIILLGGLANVTVGETDFVSIGGRATVFAGRATTLHIPPGFKFRVEAIGAVEAAIARVPSDLPGEPRLIGPEKVKISTRGKDACERQVHDVLGAGFPAKRIVVGETFCSAGRWASYPPHKHDREAPPEETRHEEVYFYKFNPPQGFGFQRVYSPERNLDESYAIRDNSLVKIPYGYHPLVVAPGYALYYLWFMAGESRQCLPYEDPDHKWTNDQ
jgi:5-deoxy-glucuronate isomerase